MLLMCNQERMTELVRALRGELTQEDGKPYVQGDGKLCTVSHNGDKCHCCAGVAADLAARAGVGRWLDEDMDLLRYMDDGGHVVDYHDWDNQENEDTCGALLLTPGLRAWYGLAEGEQRTSKGHAGYIRLRLEAPQDTAVEMNDEGCDFGQIADWIEASYLDESKVEALVAAASDSV